MKNQYQELDAEIKAINGERDREELAERRLSGQSTTWLEKADSVAVGRAFNITPDAADIIIRRLLTQRGDRLPREPGTQPGDGYPLVKGPGL